MKNETARREIESLDYYLQNHTDDYSEESHTAMMMAVKVLEQQPCEVAISRQAVQDYIAKYLSQYLYNDVREAVEVIDEYIGELPSVTPQPKTGHWIRQDNTKEPLYGWYFCSECNSVIGDKPKFCSNCGAKMTESEMTIDALRNKAPDQEGVDDLIAIIKELPSVTQKSETITEFADRCRECGARYGKLLRKWIPVSERLPEKNVEVLATTESGYITIAEWLEYDHWFIGQRISTDIRL